jgi:hypothetical protein
MLVEALDYAGARTAFGDFADGSVFAMAYRELVNSIRNINADPRYSFGYQIAKTAATTPSLDIKAEADLIPDQGLATEWNELLFGELGFGLAFEGEPARNAENFLDFGGLVPYRIARVHDAIGEYERTDLAELVADRELGRGLHFRRFAFNQDREDYARLELSHLPSGELTVIAEKQIIEPKGYDDSLDMPKNVYKFVLAWLSRSLCRRLGNAEMGALAQAELATCEKPFIATNERNKRDYRLNPWRAYGRLGSGGYASGY